MPTSEKEPLSEVIRESQLWKSVFRHPAPIDRRNRIVVMLTNFFLHLHPVSIKKQGIALSYTWCMGGVTFFLFLVETITGVLLMFYYRPTLEWAFNDILALRDATSLGIRGDEVFDLSGLEAGIAPRQSVTLKIRRPDGATRDIPLLLRIDTPVEVDYYRNGGILPYVLRSLLEN